MARILRISAPAATVIIGNPGVADVTIQDPQTLVLTGKSYGTDQPHRPRQRRATRSPTRMIEVVQAQADTMTVYYGPGADHARLRAGLPADASCWATTSATPRNTLASSSIIEGAAQLAPLALTGR